MPVMALITISLNEYLQRILNAYHGKTGDTLSQLLSFRDPHVMNPRLMLENPEAKVQSALYPPIDEVVAAHLRTIWAISKVDRIDAFKSQTIVVNAVSKFLQESKEENWMLPVMNVTCLDLRLFAIGADQVLTKNGTCKPGETLEKAAETLMFCFRVCVADTRTSEQFTKRWGLLHLVNQFLKIYFKINKLNLCKPMIRAIEALSFKDDYPLSQLITYKYYTGRKAMFDSDFKTADKSLSFAFQHCHFRSRKNKRRILIYLLPVKMLIGFLPKESLLRKYNLHQFIDIVKSVKQGNLKLLNDTFVKYESFFIGAGIYLILEKLKVTTYRNLFKKVYLIKDNHQIDIELFLKAMKWMEMEDISFEETECIITNMIYEGRIKGYISHAHKKLVVSKKDAFPPLSSC